MNTSRFTSECFEQQSKVVNNTILFDQIRLCIISDYFPKTLSKVPKGVMEFFIRDGELAINYHNFETSLRGPSVPNSNVPGMDRKKLKIFLSLLEEQITSYPTIDYGNIIINYEVMENGEIDGSINIKTQIAHRRR